jgi:hypothetical protein
LLVELNGLKTNIIKWGEDEIIGFIRPIAIFDLINDLWELGFAEEQIDIVELLIVVMVDICLWW